MMLLALASVALGADCTQVTMAEVVEVQPPAILVLGERRGTQPDLKRALSIVKKLGVLGPVTVSFESVEQSRQASLDRYAEGLIELEDVPEAVGWAHHWGFPFAPYAKIMALGRGPVTLVAAGTLPSTVHDGSPPVPAGYGPILSDAAAGAPLLPDIELRLAETMAWTDHRIAQTSLGAWDGEGYLVVLTDRTRVEGGHGVNWQLDVASDVPVHSVLLGGGAPKCYPGDRYMK